MSGTRGFLKNGTTQENTLRIPPLSDAQLSKVKPAEKDYKLSDSYGLHLLVTMKGSKLWRMQYRYDRWQKTLRIEPYAIAGKLCVRSVRISGEVMPLY
ncbi:Arm DNA-binding domain-containing protein [Chlorobium limicola]